jgi:hypothetical protein
MDTLQLSLPKPKAPLSSPVIHSCTRAQALANGILIDVTEIGEEVGFKLPVAITEALQNRLTPTKNEAVFGQDYDSRLWNVLWVAAFSIKLADPGIDTVTFTVVQQEVDAKSGQPHSVELRLRAVYGPGNEDKPVKASCKWVTIGFVENL